jgi:flagellar biosynthesis/type III secretory pathway protein FliH
VTRARILPASLARDAEPLLAPRAGDAGARRVAREEMDARLTADRLVREAEAAAAALIADARIQAANAIESAAREAREEAAAELTARWLALRAKELNTLGRDGERVIPLAVVLAERLLGASLALEPSRIADLARAVFAETRGARRAIVEAHPSDADELKRQLSSGSLDLGSVEVRSDETLARGELRLHTDVGTIDARLAPRFDRLAAAVRDALGDALADPLADELE